MLVPPEIIDLFQRIIAQTSHAFIRDEFESLGFTTSEERILSPNPRLAAKGIYTETLPVEARIEGYFRNIDWESPEQVAKVMKIVNKHFARIKFLPSGIHQQAQKMLGKHGLRFDGRRVVRL